MWCMGEIVKERLILYRRNQKIGPNYAGPANGTRVACNRGKEPRLRGSPRAGSHEEKVGTASFGRLSRGSTFIARGPFVFGFLQHVVV